MQWNRNTLKRSSRLEFIIYRHANTVTGKSYIGITSYSIEHRWKEHTTEAVNPTSVRYNYKFHRSIRKHGVDKFRCETLAVVSTIELAKAAELAFVKLYNSFENGYNMTPGGDGSGPVTEKAKIKMSSAKLGVPKTVEHRRKISSALQGRVFSSESKKHMSESQKLRREKQRALVV